MHSGISIIHFKNRKANVLDVFGKCTLELELCILEIGEYNHISGSKWKRKCFGCVWQTYSGFTNMQF